jgi:hypothetical protein
MGFLALPYFFVQLIRIRFFLHNFEEYISFIK